MAGGLGPDNQQVCTPNLALCLGLRYDRDTGRTDSDLPAIPEINAALPGYGNAVKRENMNLAPQIGFAWDPRKNGKTVIRGVVGLFYKNVIWNNVLFDRPERLRSGAFNAVSNACLSGGPNPAPVDEAPSHLRQGFATNHVHVQRNSADYVVLATGFGRHLINPQNPNPNFVGTSLSQGLGVSDPALFAPNYQPPRSFKTNFGIPREFRRAWFLAPIICETLKPATCRTSATSTCRRIR